MSAAEIIANLLIEIPKQFQARVWRRNVGADKRDDRFIRYGVPGEADITGIIAPGIRLEIEVKAGKDRVREAQAKFLAMVLDCGGIAIVARDVDGAIADIRTALAARS